MPSFVLKFSCFFLLSLVASVVSSDSLTSVTTQFGQILGVYYEEYDVRWFYGIPYAVPPIGNRKENQHSLDLIGFKRFS